MDSELLKILKRTGKIFLTVGLCLTLSGCTTNSPLEYSKRDVREYLEKEFPGEEMVIQGGSWLDQTWNCYFADLPEAVFQVSAERRGGDPVPIWTYVLTDNAANTIAAYMADVYCAEAGGNMDAWVDLPDEEIIFPLQLFFEDRMQIEEAVKQYSAFCRWAERQPHGELMKYMCAECILRPEVLPWEGRYVNRARLYYFPEDDPDRILEKCEQMLLEYAAFYNLSHIGFTREELEDYAGEQRDRKGEISYGGLYALLESLEYDLEGEPEHFSFVGADGWNYEFSYDFVQQIQISEEDKAVQEKNSWYYLRGGSPVSGEELRTAPAIFIQSDEFKLMTGVEY